MPAHLAHLLRVRSQRTEAVLAYLDAVRALPDREPPTYLGERKPTTLYVPVDVLRREKKDRDPSKAQWHRVSWNSEWPKLGRAVVRGRPGEGKTLLLRMTAGLLAEREWKALSNHRKTVREVVLPVYLRLADVADLATSVDCPLEAAFANSVSRLLATGDRRLRQQAKDALCNLSTLRSACCHLFLDALDEVPEPAVLQAALQVLLSGRDVYRRSRGPPPVDRSQKKSMCRAVPRHKRLKPLLLLDSSETSITCIERTSTVRKPVG